MVTIGVDQYLSNSAIYEHRLMEKMKKLFKYSGKCDYQQHYKAILEADMVYIHEQFTENIPMSPDPFETVKNTSKRNSIHQFPQFLDVKK